MYSKLKIQLLPLHCASHMLDIEETVKNHEGLRFCSSHKLQLVHPMSRNLEEDMTSWGQRKDLVTYFRGGSRSFMFTPISHTHCPSPKAVCRYMVASQVDAMHMVNLCPGQELGVQKFPLFRGLLKNLLNLCFKGVIFIIFIQKKFYSLPSGEILHLPRLFAIQTSLKNSLCPKLMQNVQKFTEN